MSEQKRRHGSWRVQECYPRDQFETCTLTIEQWLENQESDEFGPSDKATKWVLLMAACALALPGVTKDGLRQEPRVGYDPFGDQMFFIFKASNNGTTYLVSPHGIHLADEEIKPRPVRDAELQPAGAPENSGSRTGRGLNP